MILALKNVFRKSKISTHIETYCANNTLANSCKALEDDNESVLNNV